MERVSGRLCMHALFVVIHGPLHHFQRKNISSLLVSLNLHWNVLTSQGPAFSQHRPPGAGWMTSSGKKYVFHNCQSLNIRHWEAMCVCNSLDMYLMLLYIWLNMTTVTNSDRKTLSCIYEWKDEIVCNMIYYRSTIYF